MTKIQRTVQRNMSGFAKKKQMDACDPCDPCVKTVPCEKVETSFECLVVGQKTYLREVDNCGNQVGDIKPLGTCSIDENGALYPFDADGNQIIATEESVTTLTLNAAGDEFTYTAEDGTVTTVPFCPVCPIEVITTLVANPQGGFTYTNEAGVSTTIADASGTAVDNGNGTGTVTFPDGSSCTFLKSVTFPTDMHVTGATFQESADGSMHELILTFANGTTINAGPVVDANTFATVVDNGTTGTVTDPQGNACTFLKAETVTTLVGNPDGSFSYTNENGVVTVIPAPVATNSDSLVVNADGSLTHVAADGTVVVVPAPSVSSLVESGGVVTHTSGSGSVVSFDICAVVAANCNSPMVINSDSSITYTDNAGNVTTIPASTGETVTSLVLNAAGNEFVYTSEDGTATTVPFCAVCPVETVTTLVENPDGSFTYTNESGVVTLIPAPVAGGTDTLVANNDGSFTHTSVSGVVTVIPAPVIGGTDSLVQNPDGSFTHTSVNGTSVTIPAAGNSSLVANADGSFTHTSGSGVATTIPAATVSQLVESGGVVTHTAGDGTVSTFDICTVVAANCNSPMTLNPDGSITYVDNAGTVTTIPSSVGETVTTLVANPDGSYTYTSENSTVTTIPAPVIGGTDSLVQNPDGSFTHTSVSGVVVTIPASSNSSMVQNIDGSFTHTSGDGTVTIIPPPIMPPALLRKDGTSYLAGDAVTPLNVDSLVDLARPLDPVLGDKIIGQTATGDCNLFDAPAASANSSMVENPDGSFTHTSGDGVQTIIPPSSVSSFASNGDGTATHDDGAGNTFVVQEDIVDGGSNLVAADGVTINPLLEHVTAAPIDVTAAQFVTNNSIVPAFTDGFSDANNPDCRTEIVCGTDGKLYGPAPHMCHYENVAVGGTQNATNVTLGGGAPANVQDVVHEEEIDRLCFTNPSTCRPMWVTFDIGGRLRLQTTNNGFIGGLSDTIDIQLQASFDGGANWSIVQQAIYSVTGSRQDVAGDLQYSPYYRFVAPGATECVSIRIISFYTGDNEIFGTLLWNMPKIGALGHTC